MNFLHSKSNYADPDVLQLLDTLPRQPPPADAGAAQPNPLLSPPDSTGAFIIKPAAQWLQPSAACVTEAPLFGDFWSRGEVCILFADTNLGKSILAVQIADAITKGQPIQNFAMVYNLHTVSCNE